MNTKNLRTGLAAATGGAVLLAGLLVGASIALADDEPSAPETTTNGDAVERCHEFFRDGAHRLGVDLEEIAGEFGISLDELKDELAAGATIDDLATEAGIDLDAVLDDLREQAFDAIDDRVADGSLTQERADAIKERIESFDPGEMPFGRRGPGSPHAEGFEFGNGFGDLRGLFGDLDLDIDLSELRDSLESGMNPQEALEDLGIDLDTVVADAREAALDHLDEMVADGVLSQERADEIREMIESFDLSEGLPFDPRGFRFDFEGFDVEGFDFDRFRGPNGHGFFGGSEGDNAEAAGFSA